MSIYDRISRVALTGCKSIRQSVMRCYFIRDGPIAAVEYLTKTDDEGRIVEATELNRLKGEPRGADAFEVWDGPRFLYRFPPIL
jgi:hypothetical protein